MADRIMVSTGRLEDIAQVLNELQNLVSEVGGMLADVDTSQRSGGNLKVQTTDFRLAGSTVAEFSKSLQTMIRKNCDDIIDLSAGVHKMSVRAEEVENSAARLAYVDFLDSANQSPQSVFGTSLDENSELFDDNGSYGGNQGDLIYNKSGIQFLWWRIFKDQQYFDFVRQYPGFENYSDKQIVKLFEHINKEGCGYVAVVNSILSKYEGREQDFEATFGFPMHDKNGELNYNRLLIDFYISTDDKYYLDECYGANSIVNDVLYITYGDKPDAFKKEFGVDLYTDESHTNFTKEAMQVALDRYGSTNTTEYAIEGTTVYSLSNRAMHYFKEKGIDVTISMDSVHENTAWSTTDISKLIDSGNVVNILVSDFNLYNENGKCVMKDVGGHWMTITGVTSDGRYIVSSWGKEYYIKPGELVKPSYIAMNTK